MEILGLVLGAIAGGLANRIRGGWLSDKIGSWFGATLKRIFFGLVIGLLALTFSGLTPLDCLIVAGGIFIGMIPGWSKWWLTRDGEELFMMGFRGLVVTLPTFFATGFWSAIGIIMGPVYLLGNKIPSRVTNFSQGPEVGELIFGAILGATITLI